MGYSWRWDIIWQYQGALIEALLHGLALAATSAGFGAVAGLGIAYGCLSDQKLIRLACRVYIELWRNTPLLLIVFFVYFVLPRLGIRGLDKDESFVLALSVVASGYLAENFRAGLASVPLALMDAAKSVGLTWWQRQKDVVLPIAMGHALPALSNTLISIFKDTSLASLIAIPELTFVARQMETNYFRTFEAWGSVSAIYATISGLVALLLKAVELKLRMPK